MILYFGSFIGEIPVVINTLIVMSLFLIIFAITLFDGLFGLIGMFLGVLLIAVIQMVILDIMDYQQKKKEVM